jgi:hypothetical protein
MSLYKEKSFLYYFNKDSVVWRFPTIAKIIFYLSLNLFVLINKIYLINLVFSLIIFLILILIGFVQYRKTLFKLLGVSLLLFFLISLFLELFRSGIVLNDFEMISKTIVFITEFLSKWLLINVSGLLMFATLSQEELIKFLLKIKLDFRIIVSITIAFNLIARLIGTLEEINISLKSRGIKGRNIGVLFNKVKYTFISMLLDNIEYISSLRATYAFDYLAIKKKYGK